MSMFNVGSLKCRTSTYSDTDWTRQCVGVGSDCDCHQQLADSVTKQFTLKVDNAGFASFLASVKL